MTTKINIDAKSILKSRGLEKGGQAQRFFTSEVYRLSDNYTPFDSGILKSEVNLQVDKIEYKSPYSRYQWFGISKGGKPIKNEGAPMRGKQWTLRMWADKKTDILNSVAKLTGGKAK